jgi:hypothetical protein
MARLSRVKEKASRILMELPVENAFHFHTTIGGYTQKYATSLNRFGELLKEIDLRSIEFHLERKDFENWIKHLGDDVLALQVAKLRNKKLTGEALRSKLAEIVEKRYKKLRETAS